MKKFIFYLNLIPEIAVIVITFLFALDEKYENDNELFLGFASFLSSILFFDLLFLCIFPHNEGVCTSSNNCCDCDCDNGVMTIMRVKIVVIVIVVIAIANVLMIIIVKDL